MANSLVQEGEALLAVGRTEPGRVLLSRAVRLLDSLHQWDRAMALLDAHPGLAKVRSAWV